jgi:LysM domain
MRGPAATVRTFLVLAATAAAALPLSAVAGPPLTALAGWGGPAPTPALSFERAVAAFCAGALVGCYAVWALGLLLTVLDRFLAGATRDAVRRVPCPRLARALAVSLLGASLAVASPVSADPAHDVRRPAPVGAGPSAALSGLPLPDRVATAPVSATPAVAAPTAYRHHEVTPGDTLWAVAARALPPGAPDLAVDRAWRRIGAANRDVLDDPDLIFPGTVLRVPPLDELLGKDHS